MPIKAQPTNSIDDSLIQLAAKAQKKYQAEFSMNSIPSQKHSLYQIDQSSLRPFVPKVSHWSIAWSDLMMTMFILFLSMFVYQAQNKEFLLSENYLISNKKEIIGGDTKDAVDTAQNGRTSFPFMVTQPAAPLITSGTVKKIEPITLQDIDLESTFSADEIAEAMDLIADEAFAKSAAPPEIVKKKPVETPVFEPEKIIHQPKPLTPMDQEGTSVESLYTQSQRTLDNYNLNEFATINLVQDKTVRIVLTGDLLFSTGQATLSSDAIASLEKIATVIQDTPHQINVEGHTDDVPILGPAFFATNWELSLARANVVASFLIEDMQMNPGQFVISGYSSYRPVKPNTTVANRANNRRVEIVITKISPLSQSPEESTKS